MPTSSYNLLGERSYLISLLLINPARLWSYIGQNISDLITNQTILENLPPD
jgi:hypothetical protein